MSARVWRWAPLFIVAAATLPFLPGLTAPFSEWDDSYYVSRSARITVPGWEGLSELWIFENSLRDKQVEFFPLRDTVYWVLWQGFGSNPIPFHAANIALHALASVLLLLVALRLGLSRWGSLTAALLFAVHPVHTESVVWVSALKDPLFFSLMLGSLASYLRYRERQRPWDYALSLVLLAGALASKSLALPTVALMVAIERLIGAPTRWRLIALRLAGPLALCALSMLHIMAIGRAAGIVQGPHGGTWGSHWILIAWALVRYAQQAVVPASFRIFYCFAPAAGLADVRLWISLVALAALCALGLWLYRFNRLLCFLWLWFFLCLGPVANLIPFPALMADRYLYSPTAGVVMLAAWGLSRVRGRQALTWVVVVTLGLVTATRSYAWRRHEELWNEVAEDTACWEDPSILGVNALLQWALSQTEPERAIAAFREVTKHPALQPHRTDRACDRFLNSSIRAPLGDQNLELQASELMAYYCPRLPAAWERLAVATWHDRPDIAARAAEHAYFYEPMSFRRWRLGLARFNAHDPRARHDIEAALKWDGESICPSYKKWVESVPPERRPEFEGLASLCPAN